MSKILVSANNLNHLNKLLDKKIDGVILSIDNLSVNSSFYIDVESLSTIDFKDKEVFVSLNKIMHNSDLPYLKEVMTKLKDKNLKIIFYDMAVYNIAKEFDMVDKLIISQDHLNASNLSNNFYKRIGITGSVVTSDITKNELLEIKEKTNMTIFFLAYGYAPIFYSRRYLVTNYLKYINEPIKDSKYHIISDTNISYPISEEKYGTTIYTNEPINLINYLNDLKTIDYLIMNSNNIEDNKFNKMVDNFLNKDKVKDPYIGFFNTKTIYKVK